MEPSIPRSSDPIKQKANAVLDDIKAGLSHPNRLITWALRALGEPVTHDHQANSQVGSLSLH